MYISQMPFGYQTMKNINDDSLNHVFPDFLLFPCSSVAWVGSDGFSYFWWIILINCYWQLHWKTIAICFPFLTFFLPCFTSFWYWTFSHLLFFPSYIFSFIDGLRILSFWQVSYSVFRIPHSILRVPYTVFLIPYFVFLIPYCEMDRPGVLQYSADLWVGLGIWSFLATALVKVWRWKPARQEAGGDTK